MLLGLLFFALSVYVVAGSLKLAWPHVPIPLGRWSLPSRLVGSLELSAVATAVLAGAISPVLSFAAAAAIAGAVWVGRSLQPADKGCGCLGSVAAKWRHAPAILNAASLVTAAWGALLIASGQRELPLGQLAAGGAALVALGLIGPLMAWNARGPARGASKAPMAATTSRRQLLVGAGGVGLAVAAMAVGVRPAAARSPSGRSSGGGGAMSEEDQLAMVKADPDFQRLLAAAGDVEWSWSDARVVVGTLATGTYRSVFLPGSDHALAALTHDAPTAEGHAIGVALLPHQGSYLLTAGSAVQEQRETLEPQVTSALLAIDPKRLALAASGGPMEDDEACYCPDGTPCLECLLRKACIPICAVNCAVASGACTVGCASVNPFLIPFCKANCAVLGVGCKLLCTSQCV